MFIKRKKGGVWYYPLSWRKWSNIYGTRSYSAYITQAEAYLCITPPVLPR